MHKRAAASTMRHPAEATPIRQAGLKRAHWCVIRYRWAKTNRGEMRVYRDTYAETSEVRARARYMVWEEAPSAVAILLIDEQGEAVWERGDVEGMETQWFATRRGVNRGADPRMAAGHMRRESDPEAEWVEESQP